MLILYISLNYAVYYIFPLIMLILYISLNYTVYYIFPLISNAKPPNELGSDHIKESNKIKSLISRSVTVTKGIPLSYTRCVGQTSPQSSPALAAPSG